MSVNDIKHLAAETIYLVPDASEGQLCYLWCDDPAPGMNMDPAEAVEYLRKDVHESRVAELEERAAALAAHVERLGVASKDAIHQPRSCMMVARWEREVESAPATSLALRDAQQQRDGIINACNHVLSVGSSTHRASFVNARYAYVSTRALREYADTLSDPHEAHQ